MTSMVLKLLIFYSKMRREPGVADVNSMRSRTAEVLNARNPLPQNVAIVRDDFFDTL